MKINVIYEDKNFLAINKPAGLLVHRIKFKIKELTLKQTIAEPLCFWEHPAGSEGDRGRRKFITINYSVS